jgi:hypothetical protein
MAADGELSLCHPEVIVAALLHTLSLTGHDMAGVVNNLFVIIHGRSMFPPSFLTACFQFIFERNIMAKVAREVVERAGVNVDQLVELLVKPHGSKTETILRPWCPGYTSLVASSRMT